MAERLIPQYVRVTDYTQAEEDTFSLNLTGIPYGGALIYNTDLSASRIWNGTSFETAIVSQQIMINPPLNPKNAQMWVLQLGLEAGAYMGFGGMTSAVTQGQDNYKLQIQTPHGIKSIQL